MIHLFPVGFTSKVIKALIFSITLVTTVWAQAPVATVTSSGPFELRGANVTPGQGVPSWPGLAGDTIKAGNTPVTVTFPDRSTIILNPGSSAKLDLSGQTPVFQLTSGSASYSLKTLTAVKLMAATKVVTPSNLAGLLELGGKQRSLGWILDDGPHDSGVAWSKCGDGPRSRFRRCNWRRRFSESEPIRHSILQYVTLSTTSWRGFLLFSRQIRQSPDLPEVVKKL